jgi:chromosome segregation ATPase
LRKRKRLRFETVPSRSKSLYCLTMVAQSVSSSRAVASVCPTTIQHNELTEEIETITEQLTKTRNTLWATTIQHNELMEEIETITKQLTKTRNTLWEAQDRLRTSEHKAQQLEMHVTELLAARNQDAVKVKQIQEDNTRCLEEEAKIRESLELMKKVFTRNQLKSKEDQETIALMQEERDLLLEENQKLHSITSKQQNSKNDSAGSEPQKTERFLSDASQKNERLLSDALEKARKELRDYKKKEVHADNKIRRLKNKLLEARDSKLQYDDPGLIDRLERNVMNYVQGTEGRDEEDSNIVARAFLDEDLNESLTRNFMKNLNCAGARGAANKLDCASFNDELAGNAYPFFGIGRKPQGSFE